MDKIGIYTFFLLVYLGISRSLSLHGGEIPYIKTPQQYGTLTQGQPVSIILTDSFESGIFIPTYYHRYLIVYGFNKNQDEMLVSVSKELFLYHQAHLGMSVFRRNMELFEEGHTPLPPGALYIGDPAYGQWKYSQSGKRYWVFLEAFKEFPEIFRWGEFKPSFEFFEQMKLYEDQNRPFFGLNQEFGTQGVQTRKAFAGFFLKDQEQVNHLHHLLNDLFKLQARSFQDG